MVKNYSDEQRQAIQRRAREAVSRIEQRETDYAIWSAEHAEELEALRFDEVMTRRDKSQVIVRKINVDKNQKGLEFILSDGSVDRLGDIIEPGGWDLKNFNRNPVALFSHDPNFVVGAWSGVGVRGNALRGNLKLAPLGVSERVDEIVRLTQHGLIKSVSVGFKPLERAPLPSGGTRFIRSELYECSLVSQPCNSNALAVARSLHISPETLSMVFENRSIDDEPATPLDALADEVGTITGKMSREIKALRAEVTKLKAK